MSFSCTSPPNEAKSIALFELNNMPKFTAQNSHYPPANHHAIHL